MMLRAALDLLDSSMMRLQAELHRQMGEYNVDPEMAPQYDMVQVSGGVL